MSTTGTTTVRDDPDADRYEIVVDDELAGFSAYRLDGDRITFTHTEVGDEYAGQGLARQLVTEELADVRRRGLAVVPVCPYVGKVISRDPDEYLDLVPEDVRQRVGLHLLRQGGDR